MICVSHDKKPFEFELSYQLFLVFSACIKTGEFLLTNCFRYSNLTEVFGKPMINPLMSLLKYIVDNHRKSSSAPNFSSILY